MNLEAIALQRAAEQMERHGKDLPPNPEWRAAPKLRLVPKRSTGGKAPSCECGSCRLCQKRAWMRQWRAGNHVPVERRGKHMDPSRRCACGNRLAVTNGTGICGDCHHSHRARRAGSVARKRGYYSHGGGI